MKWWERFFRSGRNEEPEEFPDSETIDGEIVGEADEVEEQPAREVGKMLAIRRSENGSSDDRYEKFRGTPLMKAIAPSGIWVVMKFSDAMEAGQFEEEFRSAQIVKAQTGEKAIMAVYARDLKQHGERANLINAKMEDGRYVALDFYTGHRVENAVHGGWQAELVP